MNWATKNNSEKEYANSEFNSLSSMNLSHHKKGAIIALYILTMVSIVWAFLADIEVVATAPGKVVPDGRMKVIQSLDTAVVTAIHVKEGQHVREGDLLIELDPTLSLADQKAADEKLQLALLELRRLKAELIGQKPDFTGLVASADAMRLQEAVYLSRRAIYRAKLDEAKAIEQSKADFVAAAVASASKVRETLASAEEKEIAIRPLVGTAVSRFNYLNVRDAYSNAKHELDVHENRVLVARKEYAAAKSRVVAVEQENVAAITADIQRKEFEISGLEAEATKATRYFENKEMRATATGYVQSVMIANVGAVVTPSQVIATIVPWNTPLIIEAKLSNKDVGFVRPGQLVKVKVEAFPFNQYGTVPAIVDWISPDSESDAPSAYGDTRTNSFERGAFKPQQGAYSFKLRIRPVNGDAVPSESRNISLQPGMTVQADIVTDRRRVISYLTAPISKNLSEAMSLR